MVRACVTLRNSHYSTEMLQYQDNNHTLSNHIWNHLFLSYLKVKIQFLVVNLEQMVGFCPKIEFNGKIFKKKFWAQCTVVPLLNERYPKIIAKMFENCIFQKVKNIIRNVIVVLFPTMDIRNFKKCNFKLIFEKKLECKKIKLQNLAKLLHKMCLPPILDPPIL